MTVVEDHCASLVNDKISCHPSLFALSLPHSVESTELCVDRTGRKSSP